jgi:SH3-like domain-containing protein
MIIVGLVISLCGCSWFQSDSKQTETASGGQPGAYDLNPVEGSVTLHEALARVIKHQLNAEVLRLETELKNPRLKAPGYEDLTKIISAAGYVQAAQPQPQGQSSPLDAGGGAGSDIGTMWEVLDFGMLYAVSKTYRNNSAFIKEETIRRAIHNLIQKTRSAFYRGASAEQLYGEVNDLLTKTGAALTRTKEAYQASPSADSVEVQRQLIDNIRILRSIAQQLTRAKLDMGLLMKAAPGAQFRLVPPDWNLPDVPSVKKTMASLEHIALTYRPELKAAGTAPADVYQVRKSVSAVQPGLNFDPDYDSGDRSVIYDVNWWNTGLQISSDMFKLFSEGPAKSLAPGQQTTMNMAVLTQVHLAHQQYVQSLEEYQLTRMLGDADDRLQEGPARDLNDLTAIQRAVDALSGRVRHHLAFAGLENAAGRIYNAVGVDSLPQKMLAMDLDYLAKSLAQSMGQWSKMLYNAQAAYYPDARVTPPASSGITEEKLQEEIIPPVKEASPPPPEVSSKKKDAAPAQPAPAAPEPPPDFKGKQAVVINAADVEAETRPVSKEISIFRDVVSIHAAPDPKSPVKGQGLIGEKYKLMGWSPSGWLKIQMADGSIGWLPTKYVRSVDSGDADDYAKKEADGGSPPPKASPKAAPKPSAEPALPKKPDRLETIKRANVRSGPGHSYPVYYIAPQGETHPIRGITGEWFKIQAKDGKDGWVHQSVVKVMK